MAKVHLESGEAAYAQRIRAGHHQLSADEPRALGGQDTGPAPYALVLSGLVACTSITLRMYAERKGWALGPVRVDAVIIKDDAGDGSAGVEGGERIERTIILSAALDDAQRARLAEIAEKTPVTKTLRRGTPIVTRIEIQG